MNIGTLMSATSTNAAAAGTKKSAASTNGEFLTTLQQYMTESTGTSPDTTLLSFWFTGNQEQLGEALEEPTDLLASLEQLLTLQPEQLEEQLLHDPELLQMVQSWIQQAAMFLQMQGADAPSPEQSMALQVLTEQPETVMFVVRDQLEQLKSLIQQSNESLGSQQVKTTAAEGQKLLQQFESLLQQFGAKDAKPVVQQQVLNSTPQVAGHNPALHTHQMLQSVTSEGDAAAMKPMHAAMDSAATAADDGAQSNQVMTAGQFAIKAEGTGAAKAAAPIQAQHFAKDMSTFVVKQLAFTTHEGVSHAKITLYPEHLGQVDVRLTMQHGQLVAQFITEHAAAKDMIDQQLSMLRSALQSQGIQVDKLEVSQQVTQTAGSSLSSNMFQGERQSNPQGQSSSSSGSSTASTLDENGELVDAEEAHQESARSITAGSSFEASI